MILRGTATGVLLAFAAASVGLAWAGAEGALAAMKCPLARGVAGALALLAFAAGAWGLRAVRRRPAAALSAAAFHLGFALVLGGWVYNECAAPEEGFLELHAGRTGAVADAFEFKLAEFSIDRWPDTGTVRQYTSRGFVLPPGGTARALAGEPVEISVNHPYVRDGWWVYQSSFREMANPRTGRPFHFTILSCVKDVGLPFACAGGLLLLLGAFGFAAQTFRRTPAGAEAMPATRVHRLCLRLYGLVFLGAVAMLVHRGWTAGHPPMQNMYEFLMCAAALVPALTFLSAKVDRQNTLFVDVALLSVVLIPVGFPLMDGRVKQLMPALQSPFFVPHVGAYVLGYLLLVRAALGAGRRLVGVGYFLLTAGLVLGAAWGKVCWGHWWQFDPKEMWSLATWLVYAAYFHVKPRLAPKAERAFLLAGAAMIVLTLTWINLSRVFAGMHSYA
ncbi:MAG: cytochrome c biogenesis protein CcsA [Kiritimatiellia bacterium]